MYARGFASALTFVASSLGVHSAVAQGIATERLIDSITVTADREHSELALPNTVATKTEEDLRAQNLFNPEDALRYMPNLTIRKRYIGDRNALIGGRSFSTLQSARGLVLMDGYLLSNFLGRFDAPRWNMVAPEEIARIDAIYGPFSALYPGNSIGTTIAIRTRKPTQFEASVRTTGFTEEFSEYGVDDDFSGYQASAFLGDSFTNGVWFSLAANHQDASGHPMQYYTVTADAQGQFPEIAGDAIEVTGVHFDTDPRGRRRAVFGANAGAIDRTEQDQVKLRAGYAFNEWLEVDGFLALWRNDTRASNRTFMRDAQGEEVWSGFVSAENTTFAIPASVWSPGTREEQHSLWGATLRTTRTEGWNGSLVYSRYEIDKDLLKEAANPDPVALSGGEGIITQRTGTGWQTFESQAVYTPSEGDWTSGKHTLSLGFHRNEYRLRNPIFDTADWRRGPRTVAQNVFGDTTLTALYAQDEWDIDSRWSLTLGIRWEDWQAQNGGQRAGNIVVDYPSRSDRESSPKASLAFSPNDAWTIRVSAGRGVRFPTVSELFQGTATSSSIVVNDPNLKPEVSDAIELAFEHTAQWGRVRASAFQDDVRDSIFAQTNVTVTPNVTNVQNVDRVRTRGIETAIALYELGIEGMRLEGSLTYADAKILANGNFPISVGNEWPRVARWRGNLQAIWQPNEQWLASLGVRYSDRMYGRLENDDTNADVFGGISAFAMLDARLAYAIARELEFAVGLDNLTNERSYQYHPLQMRTGFLEARWSFKGAGR